jgi:hypothetical protein
LWRGTLRRRRHHYHLITLLITSSEYPLLLAALERFGGNTISEATQTRETPFAQKKIFFFILAGFSGLNFLVCIYEDQGRRKDVDVG